jgi:hypothetical protein
MIFRQCVGVKKAKRLGLRNPMEFEFSNDSQGWADFAEDEN